MPGVQEVHDVHLVAGDAHNALSLHARIPDMHLDQCERILSDIQEKVADKFGIGHTTVNSNAPACQRNPATSCPSPSKKSNRSNPESQQRDRQPVSISEFLFCWPLQKKRHS